MSRIFLSHSGANNAEAVALRDWLAAEGWDDVFLDLDPERGIAAGERWERALNEAANRCEVVLFLVSRAWLASGWCRKEVNLAHRLNKRMFGAVIDDLSLADIPGDLSGEWQLVRLTSGRDHVMLRAVLPVTHEEVHVTFSKEGLTRLKHGLERAGLDSKFFAWPPKHDPGRTPYRGLKPLEWDDAGIFFGRDASIIEATDRLRGLRESAPPRLLVILGASGAGKSSFMRAGLLPRLARDDRNFLPLPVIRPETAVMSHPVTGLIMCMEAALRAAGMAQTRAEIRSAVEGGAAALGPLLAELARKRTAPSLDTDGQTNKPPTLILPVDQGEELFFSEGAEETETFLKLLRELLSSDSPAITALFTIRSDNYEQLQSARALEGVRQQHISLPPMPQGSYAEVIRGPAARLANTGRTLDIEPELVQALLTDIEQGGAKDALPLLAFTLERLYAEYGGDGDLKLSEYIELGRVKGSIEAAVARAMQAADANPAIPRDEKARLALLRRGLIPWLAGIDPDTGGPRRRIANISEIPPESRPLIDLLVEQRLLATDVDKTTGENTIEPAHEALLRQWGLLEGWLGEDFEDLATLEGVKRAARDWHANAKDTEWLAHAGGRLEAAETVAARHDFHGLLTSDERAYLAAARQAEDERKRAGMIRLKRDRRRSRIIALGATFTAIIMAALSWISYNAWQNGLISQSGFLINLALKEVREGDAVTGILLALEGLRTRDHEDFTQRIRPYVPEVEFALDTAWRNRREREIFVGHSKNVNTAVFSPDGKFILSASKDGTARLWDADKARPGKILRGHEGAVVMAAFSPDGRVFATASSDATARLWDTRSGNELAVLKGHEADVVAVRFSAGGRRVVTSSYDATARIWDVPSGREILVLRGHEGDVGTASFSPGGKRIVTASWDETARIWDAVTGAELARLTGHERAVLTASFSPDGQYVVTASVDRTARVWEASTGRQLHVLTGHTDRLTKAIFSPSGQHIVTTSFDGSAIVWEALGGRMVYVLSGHQGGDQNLDLSKSTETMIKKHRRVVTDAVFSPDGKYIATASRDDTARLWDLATGREIAIFKGHREDVNSVAFSSGGARIVTASLDFTLRIWAIITPQDTIVLKGHEDHVVDAGFSPDGRRILTASADDTARLWDVETGRSIAVLAGHTDDIVSSSFSPDGRRVLTASLDRTARLWDSKTGRELITFTGHGEGLVAASFSPDGQRIVTASPDDTARVWDVSSGREIFVLRGHTGDVFSAVFSPDGQRILTSSQDKTARLWDASAGRQIFVLNGHGGEVLDASFSPDGKMIITGSVDRTARLWESETGRQLHVLKGHEKGIIQSAFSPDGQYAVTSSPDNTARVWEVASGREIHILRGEGDVVNAVFSPTGKKILTSEVTGSRSTASLWDTLTGKRVGILRGHGGGVYRGDFSPDGRLIVTASGDKTARLWRTFSTSQAHIDHVINLLPRCLTSEQRNDFKIVSTLPRWCYTKKKWPYHKVAMPPAGSNDALRSFRNQIIRHSKTITNSVAEGFQSLVSSIAAFAE